MPCAEAVEVRGAYLVEYWWPYRGVAAPATVPWLQQCHCSRNLHKSSRISFRLVWDPITFWGENLNDFHIKTHKLVSKLCTTLELPR